MIKQKPNPTPLIAIGPLISNWPKPTAQVTSGAMHSTGDAEATAAAADAGAGVAITCPTDGVVVATPP